MLSTYIKAYLKVHPHYTTWGAYYGETQEEELMSALHEQWDVIYAWLDNNDPNQDTEWVRFGDEGTWHKIWAYKEDK